MPKVFFSFRSAISALGLACAVTPAWGQVFRCVDANEHVTYTNIVGEGKNCKRMAVETAPPVSGTAGKRQPPVATPVNFPKVSPKEQEGRDNQRRIILSQELASEEQALATAKQALAEQIRTGNEEKGLQSFKDDIARHERNMDAIRRELAALR